MSKMMKSFRRVVILAMVLSVVTVPAGAALADWNAGDCFKMHFPQMPDLDNGLDIKASMNMPRIEVADDFLCTESGPITDIHIWGSYPNDIGPGIPKTFLLEIYSDIPAGPNVPYSRPGTRLWEYYTTVYSEILWASNLQESFYDPHPNIPLLPDTQVWQYNFDIPIADAYPQVEGNIYWLGVIELDGNVTFGWKTSADHWNDGAVWTGQPRVPPSPGPQWLELLDPAGAPLDMSFVITTDTTGDTGNIVIEKQTEPDGSFTSFDFIDPDTDEYIATLQDGMEYWLACLPAGWHLQYTGAGTAMVGPDRYCIARTRRPCR
ncbi:hypothetical protein ACFLVF_00590 [Chloroflexota bacterium]